MDVDEYDYLDKAADKKKTEVVSKERDEKRSSRRRREHDDDERVQLKKENREHRDKERDDERNREKSSSRSERKEKDHHRDRDRDREYDKDKEREKERSRRRHREEEELEMEKERSRRRHREEEELEMEKERERSTRSSSRSRRHEREEEVEYERDRLRRSESRSRKHDREAEMEYEREKSRRSRSRPGRHEREADMEMDRARSRERDARERDAEKELRESRKLKERKEVVEPEADPERDQRTVFAYQMPLKASERDVFEFFSQVGKVRDVHLIMDRNSRRSKGVGYIEFYDVSSVQEALQLSGKLLLGQPVMVKHSEAEKNLVQSNTGTGANAPGAERKLYVGNLHFNMTEDQLRAIFEAFGPVELVQLPLDMETGHCKGFGFVQFAQLEHAKAAQQNLNGTLEIAGRIVKVSSVTEHVTVQDSGTNVTDFDDDDGGGLALNARSRAILMQKLDRTGTATSIAESLGVPQHNGANPILNAFPLPNGVAAVASARPALLPVGEPIGDPSDCILLKNMFDPNSETEPDFDLDIKEDVQDECSKFGMVKHIFVDKNSSGHVYLKFGSVAAAVNCQRAMHMRWFARRCISALFMRPHEYDAKFRTIA